MADQAAPPPIVRTLSDLQALLRVKKGIDVSKLPKEQAHDCQEFIEEQINTLIGYLDALPESDRTVTALEHFQRNPHATRDCVLFDAVNDVPAPETWNKVCGIYGHDYISYPTFTTAFCRYRDKKLKLGKKDLEFKREDDPNAKTLSDIYEDAHKAVVKHLPVKERIVLLDVSKKICQRTKQFLKFHSIKVVQEAYIGRIIFDDETVVPYGEKSGDDEIDRTNSEKHFDSLYRDLFCWCAKMNLKLKCLNLTIADNRTFQKFAQFDGVIQTEKLELELKFGSVADFVTSVIPKIDMSQLEDVWLKMLGTIEEPQKEISQLSQSVKKTKLLRITFEQYFGELSITELLTHDCVDLNFHVVPRPAISRMIRSILHSTVSKEMRLEFKIGKNSMHQILMNERTSFRRKDDEYRFFVFSSTKNIFKVIVEEGPEAGYTSIRFNRFQNISPLQRKNINLETIDHTTVQKFAVDTIHPLVLSFDLHFDFVSVFESSIFPKIDMFYLCVVEIKMTGKSEKSREETLKMLELMKNINEVSLKFEYYFEDLPLPEIFNRPNINLSFCEDLPEPVLQKMITEVLRLTHSEKGTVYFGNNINSLREIFIKRPEMDDEYVYPYRDVFPSLFFIESCDRAFKIWVHYGFGDHKSYMEYERCSAVWMDENRECMKEGHRRSLFLL